MSSVHSVSTKLENPHKTIVWLSTLNAFLSHMKEGPCLPIGLGSLRAHHLSGVWFQEVLHCSWWKCTRSQQGALDHFLVPTLWAPVRGKWWGVVLECGRAPQTPAMCSPLCWRVPSSAGGGGRHLFILMIVLIRPPPFQSLLCRGDTLGPCVAAQEKTSPCSKVSQGTKGDTYLTGEGQGFWIQECDKY